MPAATSQYPVRDAVRQRVEIACLERPLGVVETPDQQKPPGFEIAGMRGVRPVAVRGQRRPRRPEPPHRPAEVARDERDLGLGDEAARPGRRLVRAEAPRSAPQQLLRAGKVAELRHRDAAQRERRRIVAQRHSLQAPPADRPPRARGPRQ